MKTVRLTMAQALLRFLENQYVSMDGKEHKFVNGVLGIFGHGNVTGIGEALEYMPTGLTYIRGSNEQGLVHVASAYAKQKNRLGIFAVTSSIGPGATNMITGAATATVNRLPVLLLPGDVFACRQPDPVLQQLEVPWNYTVTANDCFKPVSRYWDRIARPEQLMTAMLNAMRVLTDPVDTGAVTVCLSQDVQAEAYDYPETFFRKRVHYIDRRQPSRRALDLAVKKILGARRPLIIAGGGVHYSFASGELAGFARAFGIPVAETQAGKSAVSWDDRMSVGGIGVTGTSAANLLARSADLIFAVGSRLADFTTSSKQLFRDPDAEILHLNVSSFDGLKMDGILLQADAKAGLEAIRKRLEAKRYRTSASYRDRIGRLKKAWDREVDRLYGIRLKDGICQTTVVGEVNRFLGEDDIILCAAGSLPGDLQRLWRCRKPKSYHMEYGNSCMGYEVAGGLGAKLASPQSEVYVIISDGSFLMLNSELLTSIQERIKINIVMLDNGGFQCIKNLQISRGSRGFGNELRYRDARTLRLEGGYIPLDFAKYAEALGAKSFRARTIEELRRALKAARAEKVSTLIDIKVTPGTMTHGYESWWRVGVAEASKSPDVRRAYRENLRNIGKCRAY
jgi:3D-(3,5/4)-trihydroxycyclohexane-1,2-dione acylhydrolase (decyclizing)